MNLEQQRKFFSFSTVGDPNGTDFSCWTLLTLRLLQLRKFGTADNKPGKFSPCQSSSLQGPVEARVVRVSFYFSTFKLAGKNICEASFLGTAALVKICCEHSCSFTDPFPPRDDRCFSLSLSLLSFLIRRKTIG